MTIAAFGKSAVFTLGLVVLCSCASAQSSKLPPEASINKEAGHGGFLIVKLQMNGEELPFILDTGASGTLFDKSMEPKLGKSIGTMKETYWGVVTEENVYAMPKLSLGGVPLIGGEKTFTSSNNPPQAVGILGYDFLQHYCIQLDFAAGKLRFLDDEHANKSK